MNLTVNSHSQCVPEKSVLVAYVISVNVFDVIDIVKQFPAFAMALYEFAELRNALLVVGELDGIAVVFVAPTDKVLEIEHQYGGEDVVAQYVCGFRIVYAVCE